MSLSLDQPILIAGAGIAGLTAAIALARAGFAVKLIERATRFEEIGAGLQLSPNASRVLIGLGLASALGRRATAPEALAMRRLESGRLIGRAAMNAPDNRFGAPFWTTLRADLQTALVDAARGESAIGFLVGRTIDDVQDHGDRVSVNVRTASGGLERIEGAALIGADGLWSRVRAAIGDAAPNRFTGYEAWRAVLPIDQAPEMARAAQTNLWMSRDAHLVHYPVAGGKLVNIVLVRRAERPRDDAARGGWNDAGDAAALADLTRRKAGPARDLVAAARDWRVWSLFDRDPSADMARGRIALIGDAAHPILPFLAQGAALAIEDAVVLAQECARRPDKLDEALRRYAARRHDRAQRVQRASRANAKTYHAGGIVAFARDLFIARMGDAGMLKRYQWLYGWTPDQ
jgi:salicylate hydroxylase